MTSQIIAMITFAFVGAVTPGPVNLLATSTAASQGVGEAIKHVVAASFAYALVVALCGVLMQSLLTVLPALETLMQWFGSAFLLYLAYQIFTAPSVPLAHQKRTQSGWWTGSITQLLNPKAWLYALSGVSIYVLGQHHKMLWLALYVLVSLLVCLVGIGVWAWLGHCLAQQLSYPHRQTLFNRAMALVLTLSVVVIWI
ncbi:LysE family translocator [Motilimonas sp. KMU-193]|uniref:LysE family translocator n=1 Tax=Motilimonas sp. KMU-193 TaxID=3388668 RepID=UPI00396B3807